MTKNIHIGPMSDDAIKKTVTDEHFKEIFAALARGNVGAAVALSELAYFHKDKPEMSVDLLLLEKYNITGSDIWIGWKDICDRQAQLFSEKLRNGSLKKAIEEAK